MLWSGYQIEAVELQFAEEANLTITEGQLLGLSDSAAQRLGISPLILLFVIGLVLLKWVREEKTG